MRNLKKSGRKMRKGRKEKDGGDKVGGQLEGGAADGGEEEGGQLEGARREGQEPNKGHLNESTPIIPSLVPQPTCF